MIGLLSKALSAIEKAMLTEAVRFCRLSYNEPTGRVFNEAWYHEMRPGGVLVFVVAGSDDPKDWKQNLAPGTADYYGLKDARKGFVLGARAISPRLKFIINEYLYSNVINRIQLIGHSSGAAKCLCLASMLLTETKYQIDCVLLACPRVVYRKPEHDTDRLNVIEFHAWGDIVPRLPFYIPWLRPYKRLGYYRRCGRFSSSVFFRELMVIFCFRFSPIALIGVFKSAHLLPAYDPDESEQNQ